MGIFLTVLSLDQLSKYLASRFLPPRSWVEVVGSVFRLTLVRNPAGVFGMVGGGKLLYLYLSFLAVGLIGFYLTKVKLPIYRFSLALILGGALGNLADRIRFREVDVSRDSSAARDLARRGYTGVPVVFINNRPVVGFNKAEIDRLLGIR